MHSTSPPRRAAALLAVSTIALSTAVLSVTGVASAIPEPLQPYSVTTAPDDGEGWYDEYAADAVVVLDGYCSIDWALYGGAGGSGTAGWGANGGALGVTTTVTSGQTYGLFAGTVGADADEPVEAVDAVQDDPDTLEDETVEGATAVPGASGAGGTNGKGSNGAAGTESPANEFGGGGGAMSEVYLGTTRRLSAFGGDGAGAGGGAGAGNEDNTVVDADTIYFDSADSSGPGVIEATVNPCEPAEEEETRVTGAPIAKWVDGIVNGLDFQLTISTVSDDAPVTGVEYSLDGGTWTGVDTENEGDYQYEGTISGLQTGTSYSVSFRFTTLGGGHTAASEALTAAPVLPAPAGVAASAGPSSITVGWQALTGEPGVTGYTAWALPAQDKQFGNEPPACETYSASALSCVIGVPVGVAYRVVVMARDTQLGAPSAPVLTDVVEAVAVSATLPRSNGTLTSSDADGKVVAGEKVTISGRDFLPGSTVELVVYSTPVKLGTAVVLADGTFSATVTLPKELANGVHHLVATGVDVNGAVRNMVVEVTVSGGTATVSGGLAYTGFTALPFVGAGVLALTIGGGLLVATRRRQA